MWHNNSIIFESLFLTPQIQVFKHRILQVVLFGQIRAMAKSDKQPTVKQLSDSEIDQIFSRIGKALKERRIQMDISLDDLAYESGVSRSTLTRMLDGEDVNVRNLLKVVYSLNLSIDQVISFKK